MNYVETMIDALIADRTLRSATKYVTPKQTIRVTRRFKGTARSTRAEFVVTVGAPNYLAVKFIKLCVKAKEPFPVLRVQFSKWPVKRKPQRKE